MRKAIAIFLGFVTISGCSQPERTLTLLDSRSGNPVEGALVFSPGERSVHRSDLHGRVTLPGNYGREGVAVHAKNYQPRNLYPFDGSAEVLLQYDEALVNPVESLLVFTRKDSLRGTYGPFRENNDLLSYGLDIKVDPEQKSVTGKNAIHFTMLEDGDRIQLDLFDNMNIDSILFRGEELSYVRDFNAVFVDFPETLEQGEAYSVDFHYSGHPVESGRFGCMSFREDSLGNPWVATACQNIGSSVWWPNKDQQPDEVDSMTISVTVPSELTNVSNGQFLGADDLGDGTTRYDYKVHYPINNYSVSVNIADYRHFADTLGDMALDYYVLPYHLEDAKRQFTQAKSTLQCFERFFGDYPFPKDGYKLIEVPYSGMEHQSAVTYGNLFQNGYLGRDWTGVGVSTKFDFIIVHESAHEWFGNSVTARDVSDAWIQEGWGTYAEVVYVECMFGREDADRYVNGYKSKVRNAQPIIGPSSVHHWPTGDQYFKGALFLNTLRHVVDDDETWWTLLRDYTAHFTLQNIWTTDVINFFNAELDRDLRPVFEQYLYHAALPVLQVEFEDDAVRFRWQADVDDFDMPVKVRANGTLRTLHPTTEWQSESMRGVSPEDWKPATDLFYIAVESTSADPATPRP